MSRGQPATGCRSRSAAAPAQDTLETAATALRGLLDCDRVCLLERRAASDNRVSVWRSGRSTGEPATVMLVPLSGHPLVPAGAVGARPPRPVRLSDVRVEDQLMTRAAVRTVQHLLGRYQLALPLSCGPEGGERAWLLVRDGTDFAAAEMHIAGALLPLLVTLDRVHPARVPDGTGRPGDTQSAWSRLSPRERQVIDLLVAGHTARRMGSVLGISPRTVGKHLQNAYDKLGQHDRLVIAVEHRLAEERSRLR